MAIIVDTDVIIKGERGTFDLRGWLAAQIGQDLQLAAVTVAELWHGVERATAGHRATRERYIRAITESLPVIPYTEATAFVHARIWAALESSGNMIGAHDLILAATALERGSSVATFNTRHFAQVHGLKIVEPS
jgi:predicted nucleic acid-binding protein